MSKVYAGLLVALIAVANGCGSAETSDSASSASSTSAQQDSDASIAGVVQEFLTAVKAGDSAIATSKLTPRAQQLMRQSKQGFALVPDQSSSFKVGAVERMQNADDQAAVKVFWMEPDETGNMAQQNWTVALERNNGTWGIIGIIGEMMAGGEPMVLDFEDAGESYTIRNKSDTNPQLNRTPQQNSVPQQATRPAVQDPFRK